MATRTTRAAATARLAGVEKEKAAAVLRVHACVLALWRALDMLEAVARPGDDLHDDVAGLRWAVQPALDCFDGHAREAMKLAKCGAARRRRFLEVEALAIRGVVTEAKLAEAAAS